MAKAFGMGMPSRAATTWPSNGKQIDSKYHPLKMLKALQHKCQMLMSKIECSKIGISHAHIVHWNLLNVEMDRKFNFLKALIV